MSHAKKALIVGGGVAGPVAAMALRQAGIDSVVYEAYAGGADDAGSFLTFASNGLDALSTIDAHQLGARYDATQANITFKVYSSRATRIEVWIYKDKSGEFRFRFKASNGQTLFSSEGYSAKASAVPSASRPSTP